MTRMKALGRKIKEEKMISRGLKTLSSSLPPPYGTVAGLASQAAGALGFKRSVKVTMNPKVRSRRAVGMAESVLQEANGPIVADNAPIAFARERLKPTNDLQTLPDGTVRVHSLEFFGWNSGTAAGTGWNSCVTPPSGPWASGSWVVSPLNETLFPWLSTVALNYEMFKLKALRVHYQHYVATTTAGATVIYYQPDAMYNGNGTGDQFANLADLSQGEVLNSELWGECAVYEDFCLDVPITDLMGQWKYCAVPFAQLNTVSTDPRQNTAGAFNVYNHDFPAGTLVGARTGDLYVEAIFDFKIRKVDNVTLGLVELTSQLPHVEPETAIALIRGFAAKIENRYLDSWDRKQDVQRRARERREKAMKEASDQEETLSQKLQMHGLETYVVASTSSTPKPQVPTIVYPKVLPRAGQ